MPIARIENGAFVEQRDMALADVPEHKRAAWRPIEGDPPDVDLILNSVAGPVLQIEADRVLRVWQVTPRPATVAAVKEEAQRRIVVATGATDITGCFVKQLNAQMRAAELINKKADGGTLTEAEAAEAAALQAFAATIKAIRAASNTIEAALPASMGALLVDSRWP